MPRRCAGTPTPSAASRGASGWRALDKRAVGAERVVELREQHHVRPRDGRRVEQAGNLVLQHSVLKQGFETKFFVSLPESMLIISAYRSVMIIFVDKRLDFHQKPVDSRKKHRQLQNKLTISDLNSSHGIFLRTGVGIPTGNTSLGCP